MSNNGDGCSSLANNKSLRNRAFTVSYNPWTTIRMSSMLNRMRLTNTFDPIHATVPPALVVIRIFKPYVLVLNMRSMGLMRFPFRILHPRCTTCECCFARAQYDHQLHSEGSLDIVQGAIVQTVQMVPHGFV